MYSFPPPPPPSSTLIASCLLFLCMLAQCLSCMLAPCLFGTSSSPPPPPSHVNPAAHILQHSSPPASSSSASSPSASPACSPRGFLARHFLCSNATSSLSSSPSRMHTCDPHPFPHTTPLHLPAPTPVPPSRLRLLAKKPRCTHAIHTPSRIRLVFTLPQQRHVLPLIFPFSQKRHVAASQLPRTSSSTRPLVFATCHTPPFFPNPTSSELPPASLTFLSHDSPLQSHRLLFTLLLLPISPNCSPNSPPSTVLALSA